MRQELAEYVEELGVECAALLPRHLVGAELSIMSRSFRNFPRRLTPSSTKILGHWRPENSFNAPDSENMEMTQMLDIQELPGHSGREDEPWLVMPYASMLEGNEILQREQEIVASYVVALAERGTELVMASSSTTLCLAAGCLSRRQTGCTAF
jgi:hypothetical protein